MVEKLNIQFDETKPVIEFIYKTDIREILNSGAKKGDIIDIELLSPIENQKPILKAKITKKTKDRIEIQPIELKFA